MGFMMTLGCQVYLIYALALQLPCQFSMHWSTNFAISLVSGSGSLKPHWFWFPISHGENSHSIFRVSNYVWKIGIVSFISRILCRRKFSRPSGSSQKCISSFSNDVTRVYTYKRTFLTDNQTLDWKRKWRIKVTQIPRRSRHEISSGTLFEIFIFCPRISIFWVKNLWKCWGFGLFSCWQLWFHEKNCQKNLGRKTRESHSLNSSVSGSTFKNKT